ncbi:MAG: hypothetical protein HRU32_13325 [Rhodobacteraceae bacterium]|nr:hypothetical protein [Paracoccaceae bacterium]
MSAFSDNGSDREFRLRGDGNGFCDGSWTGGGADYAEYFEWADGNPSGEDRRGWSVKLVNGKLEKANNGDDILGVVSANPSVVGDGDVNGWKKKHLTDDFGSKILEDYEVVEWVEVVQEEVAHVPATYEVDDNGVLKLGEDNLPVVKTPEIKGRHLETKKHSYPTDRVPDGVVVPSDAVVVPMTGKNGRPKLNPDYDENLEYVHREDRPEWDTVGLMGKLRVKSGEAIGPNWIKMRDISPSVAEYFVR